MKYPTYTIAARQFQLRPLTHRQRSLISAVEQRLRAIILALAKTSDMKPADTLDAINTISIDMDALRYAEDEHFIRFLATVLVPAEAEKWTPEMIEENKALMWELDEETEAKVMSDFFSRAVRSPIASPVSMSASPTPRSASETSGQQKDAVTTTL